MEEKLEVLTDSPEYKRRFIAQLDRMGFDSGFAKILYEDWMGDVIDANDLSNPEADATESASYYWG